ncbi:MAG: PepSY domain-containing protein [Stenotrophomonas sp.]
MPSAFRYRPLLAVVAALVAVGAGVAPAMAQQTRGEIIRANETRGQAPERSLSDAVRRVQRETGGRILGAERVPFDGRDINRVKFMDDRGRVRYMDDPAPSRSAPQSPYPADPATTRR